MKTLVLVVAAAFALMPALALADGCHGMKPVKSTAACAPGQIWDAAQQACVSTTTS